MSFLIAVAGAGGLLLLASGLPVFDTGRLRRRIEPYLGGLHGRPSRLTERPRSYNPFTSRLEARLRPWAERDHDLDLRLQAAGSSLSPEAFRLRQFSWAMTFFAGIGTLVLLGAGAGVALEPAAVAVLAGLAFAGGFLGRDWWLTRETMRRHEGMQEELPTAIDLVTLSIMAGESVTSAWARVARVLETGIGVEFARVVTDVRAGAPVIEALESMSRRLPDPGVGRFVDAVCTGIEKGAPLSDVLRAQADDGRELQRRRLLELGGRREVLMLVPVVFLIMPVVVVFALYPGLVSLDLLVP